MNPRGLFSAAFPRFEDKDQFIAFPNFYTRRFIEQEAEFKIKWWWLTRLDFSSATYYTWRHPHWWWMLKWSILRPVFRFLVNKNLWRVEEGDMYTNGHWIWQHKLYRKGWAIGHDKGYRRGYAAAITKFEQAFEEAIRLNRETSDRV